MRILQVWTSVKFGSLFELMLKAGEQIEPLKDQPGSYVCAQYYRGPLIVNAYSAGSNALTPVPIPNTGS